MAVMPLLIEHRTDVTDEPICYGSPAKPTEKRWVHRVEQQSSCDKLLRQFEQAEERPDDDDDEPDDETLDLALVQTSKKSSYWNSEVEEKVGLTGADPYGLLELEDKRWLATADEVRKAYRRLVLTLHPDKKAGNEAAENSPKKKAAAKAVADDDIPDVVSFEDPDAEVPLAKKEEEEEEGEEKEDEDTEFKLLSAAWELLGNVDKRRAFDSVDYFNDYLPGVWPTPRSLPKALPTPHSPDPTPFAPSTVSL